MATTRRKPATATKAAATTKVPTATKAAATTPATRAGTSIAGEPASPASVATPVASTSASTAVMDPPPAKTAAPSGIERRRSPREKMVAPAVLQPSSGDASVDRGVQVQDLSLGGVGFVATEKFDAGEVYRITLGKGPLLLNARVRIVSCNKTGHRMYRCGAEFC
jgi:hypothetical protein